MNITEDDMSIKICSDVNRKRCCGGGLSKGTNQEFSRNQVENWDVDEIGGNCRDEEFEVMTIKPFFEGLVSNFKLNFIIKYFI